MPHFERKLDDLLAEVQSLFEQQLNTSSLSSISKKLQIEYKRHMALDSQCMLPSFNYKLPTGREHGTYLALEVGGSNLRMALVELLGSGHKDDRLQSKRNVCFAIDDAVRHLQDYAFFDWIAQRIQEMLSSGEDRLHLMGEIQPLSMGVAWSFPIDQTSIRSGNILGMGKGFHCSDAVRGHDLGEIIQQACQRANVNVRLEAIINDSSSALLTQAYLDPATRLACILGTGMNAAVHLPIGSLHPSKFGSRTLPQDVSITAVLTNTELSMYGKNIFLATRWDGLLNSSHALPDYQPFEYLVAGRYMGELVRLIMTEATQTAGLLDGSMPLLLETPYSLDTKTLAQIESDRSNDLNNSRSLLHKQYSFTQIPSFRDVHFVRQITQSVTRRSMVYFAAGIQALSSLLQDLEDSRGLQDSLDYISVGCDGSVINRYPAYMERVQDILDELSALENGGRKRVILEKTPETAVSGAGVAAALAVHSPYASGE